MTRRQMFALGLIGMLAVAVTPFAGCSKQSGDPWPDKPRVMTSFLPIYCFAANVAGDDATVRCLVTSGPHDYQLTVLDAVKVKEADLFFINGLGLDDNFKKLVEDQKPKMIDIGKCIPPGQLRPEDPHVWLGIEEAVQMVGCIRDQLAKSDPAHAAGYQQRASDYITKLRQLEKDGNDKLDARKKQLGLSEISMVSFHDSLGYFARSFHLTIEDVIQLHPGHEGSTRRRAELLELCISKKVRLITVEPQYPPGLAEELIKELANRGITNVAKIEIDPLETVDPQALGPDKQPAKDYYEKKIRANIDNVVNGLK